MEELGLKQEQVAPAGPRTKKMRTKMRSRLRPRREICLSLRVPPERRLLVSGLESPDPYGGR